MLNPQSWVCQKYQCRASRSRVTKYTGVFGQNYRHNRGGGHVFLDFANALNRALHQRLPLKCQVWHRWEFTWLLDPVTLKGVQKHPDASGRHLEVLDQVNKITPVQTR